MYFPNDPRCTVRFALRNYFGSANYRHWQGPTAICQFHRCDPNQGCMEGLPAPNDPRCNDKPPNPATPVQDQDCNAWLCSNGACVWAIKPNGVCDVRISNQRANLFFLSLFLRIITSRPARLRRIHSAGAQSVFATAMAWVPVRAPRCLSALLHALHLLLTVLQVIIPLIGPFRC